MAKLPRKVGTWTFEKLEEERLSKLNPGVVSVKIEVVLGLKRFMTEEFTMKTTDLKLIFRRSPEVRELLMNSPKGYTLPIPTRNAQVTAFATVEIASQKREEAVRSMEAIAEMEEKTNNEALERLERKDKIMEELERDARKRKAKLRRQESREIEQEITVKNLKKHRPKPTTIDEDDDKPQRPRRVSPESEEFKKNKFGEQIEDSWKDLEK